MKTAAGIDIGASTSKAVILVDGELAGCSLVTTRTPAESALAAIDEALAAAGLKIDKVGCIVATGRGRAQVAFAQKSVTEVACAAAGAVRTWGPSVRTLLDAGGISCRVVHCTEKGRARRISYGTTNARQASAAPLRPLPRLRERIRPESTMPPRGRKKRRK